MACRRWTSKLGLVTEQELRYFPPRCAMRRNARAGRPKGLTRPVAFPFDLAHWPAAASAHFGVRHREGPGSRSWHMRHTRAAATTGRGSWALGPCPRLLRAGASTESAPGGRSQQIDADVPVRLSSARGNEHGVVGGPGIAGGASRRAQGGCARHLRPRTPRPRSARRARRSRRPLRLASLAPPKRWRGRLAQTKRPPGPLRLLNDLERPHEGRRAASGTLPAKVHNNAWASTPPWAKLPAAALTAMSADCCADGSDGY